MFKGKMIMAVLLSFFAIGYASADQINPICFKNSGDFEVGSTETIKVKIPNTATDIFFLQGSEFVPYKPFGEMKPMAIPYVISGVSSGDKDKFRLISDNNPLTAYSFDDLNDKDKNIVLDFRKSLSEGDFYFNADYSYDGVVRYQISDDNANYSDVLAGSITDFNFRYLKIRFTSQAGDANLKKALIRDINFYKSSDSAYLVKPIKTGKISLYANYDCARDQIREIYFRYYTKNSKTAFPIDSSTQEITPEFKTNPSYNDDFDKDTITNDKDNCRFAANQDQKDSDLDLIGDKCDYDNSSQNPLDGDQDKDGVGDSIDNCRYVFNPDQKDTNSDRFGDACMDDDRDSLIGRLDNCPDVSNPDQLDVNINGIGDSCEFDKDNDGIFDSIDNCMTISNPDQKDADDDGIGDKCDNCRLYNPDQYDKDRNNLGDTCDAMISFEKTHDKDRDSKVDSEDNCKDIPNPGQEDLDRDGIGNACDNCLSIQNPDQKDEDRNSVGDMCEDSDKDGIEGFKDNCMNTKNADQKDSDNDGIGDVCEDKDYDDIMSAKDNCPDDHNPDQSDVDKDGRGDACDIEDNRFIESNKVFFIGLLVLISGIFGVGIVTMIKKIR